MKGYLKNMNKRWIPIQHGYPNTHDRILVYKRGDRIENKLWRRGNTWQPDVTHWMLAPERPDEPNAKTAKMRTMNVVDDLIEHILKERIVSKVFDAYRFLKNINITLKSGSNLESNEIERIEEINRELGR